MFLYLPPVSGSSSAYAKGSLLVPVQRIKNAATCVHRLEVRVEQLYDAGHLGQPRAIRATESHINHVVLSYLQSWVDDFLWQAVLRLESGLPGIPVSRFRHMRGEVT